MLFKRADWPEALFIDTPAGRLQVQVRRNHRAKRFILRLDRDGEPVMTVPPGARPKSAQIFLLQHGDWLVDRMGARPKPVPLAPGSFLPLRDIPHLVAHRPKGPTIAWIEQIETRSVLCVTGRREHLARRLGDWLRATARNDLQSAVARCCHDLGVRPVGLRITDPKTRWGSCSSARRLSFSWRLILAPVVVLDYVAAHECAHLVELNHSRAFWRIVDGLHGDPGGAKSWLKEHGAGLHRYG